MPILHFHHSFVLLFCTTRPMETFADLLELTVCTDVNLPTHFGIDKYFLFLQEYLQKSQHLTRRVPNIEKPLVYDERAYLNHDAHYEIIMASEKHPLHPLAHDLYWIVCRENQSLPSWFFHPYSLFDRHLNGLLEQLNLYMPPLVLIRLLHSSLSIDDALCIVSARFTGKPLPFLPEATYDEYLRDVMDRKHLAYSLVTNFYDNYQHNCKHYDCPFFSANLCKQWILLPKDFQECQFPHYFQAVTAHSIDMKAGKLKPVKLRGDL